MRFPLNKLAILAFALLIFFSTMLWYLANGSLNEYLKSQVLLQSQYYSGQKATLLNAEYSTDDGATYFNDLTLTNLEGLSAPLILSVGQVTAQLAQTPTSQLNSPSIQKKTITVVTIEKLMISNLGAWSEIALSGEENLELLAQNITMQLASDYPALYPEISAKIYAAQHPELNEKLALEKLIEHETKRETNQAVIQANAVKQKKRLLGKAQTRIIISSVIINNAKLTRINKGRSTNMHFKNIELGSFGGEHGLDSNQLGGELLKAILNQLSILNSKHEESNTQA